MIKAILFDLDGTLLNTLADLAAACNSALRALGYPEHAVAEYADFVGNGRHKLVLRMLPANAACDEAMVAKAEALFDDAYHAHLMDATEPYPGVPELLDALKAGGLKLGVISNKPDAFVQQIITEFFPGVFSVICGGADGVLKPNPAGVNKALERLQLKPHEALYVGDSGVDAETAHNAHMDCCGVTWGFRGKEELLCAGARYTIDVPIELMSIALPGTTTRGMRIFSLAVVIMMLLCLVGVIYSLAVGNAAGLTAGIIFPAVLGFAATRIVKKH